MCDQKFSPTVHTRQLKKDNEKN